MIEAVATELWTPQGHVQVDLIDLDSGRVRAARRRRQLPDHDHAGPRQMVAAVHVGQVHPQRPGQQSRLQTDGYAHLPRRAHRVLERCEHREPWHRNQDQPALPDHRMGFSINRSHRSPANAVSSTSPKRPPRRAPSHGYSIGAPSQGNGTFQSVGWTRIHEKSGSLTPSGPRTIISRSPPFPCRTLPDSGGLWWDGTAWFTLGRRFRLPSINCVTRGRRRYMVHCRQPANVHRDQQQPAGPRTRKDRYRLDHYRLIRIPRSQPLHV